MNKLFKYILIGIALISLCFAQAKADLTGYDFVIEGIAYPTNAYISNNWSYKLINLPNTSYINNLNGYICISNNYFSTTNEGDKTLYFCTNNYENNINLAQQNDCINKGTITYNTNGQYGSYCYNMGTNYGNKYIYIGLNSKTSSYQKISFFLMNGNPNNGENCEECEECTEMTQTQCEQNYNLIPINSIDNSYCELNGLCTICGGGSGEINTGTNWSSLFLNGTQINSNAIIDIYADDRLNTEVEYLNDTVDINITQNIDTSYIEEVKNKEKLTPTNEDVEYMIQGLQVYIPYIFIGMIIVYTLYLIKKFFRG